MNMSNQLPRITVLIANHNYQDWVVESIDSAINQTYSNIHVVIVDSASTDSSIQNINDTYFKKPHNKSKYKDYTLKTTSVKNKFNANVDISFILLSEKLGPSFARNVGIEYSIKDTVAYAILDADDYMYPNKVDRLYREMFSIPGLIGVVYADYHTLNTVTNIKILENKEAYSQTRLMSECIVHSGSLVLTKALELVKDGNGYYDNNLMVAEDWDLWIRISKSFMMIRVPEPLTLVRVSPKNTSSTVNQNIWQSCWKRISDKVNGLL